MSLYSTQLLRTHATHPWSPSQVIDAVWARFSESLSSFAWGPLTTAVRDQIFASLSRITEGELVVVTGTETVRFGHPSTKFANLKATLRVKEESFWLRVALFTDLGLAEGFMYGEADVECDDISALIKVMIANRNQINGVYVGGIATRILAAGRSLTLSKFMGNLTNSKANISAHYDLGNTMFSAFLSEDMNYSSAFFKDFNEDITPGAVEIETLESAQQRKMRHLLKKLRIQPGDRVLEIGTGWGSLSILAAQTVPDCTIDTITLSAQQAALARERIATAGLDDRITVHYMDFREALNKPEWQGAFDRFVSIEMIENVGRHFIEEYWRVVNWTMKPANSVGVVQVITMPEERIPRYDQSGADFIQKWIFPGCYIPSLTFLLTTMEAGSHGRLTVDSVANIGPHYARTLREWKRKFLSNWEPVVKKALVEDYSLGEEDLEIFRRKWIYYFDYCEAGFAMRALGDHIITFTRPNHQAFGCDFSCLG
ncbi:hypothetical protein BOTBODRAFT_33696 [Botryobasidium botryosum FD-172 SS1]|uniref:Cyclopropane-fatty-acyl-phospholipid synthase n=1 Tax=Botryobasidium botryosum (strain FD-172 SS1) TaxID=930990 RepID=A0A067MP80_BOTB1|nr:hypothetical protein BOTBODRAFT_33696 [Botryobasidium botryosum FD-172 SS1]